jgi:biotin-(acetyl-CoA carboxylase) ligase
VLCQLRVWYDALASSPAGVVAAWRRRAVAWWGESVEIRTGSETLRGRLLDVDEEGALLVASPDGRTRRVLSGEVTRVRRAG